VLVFQTAGKKRWRVFGSPSPQRKPLADPLVRGKGNDALPFSDLEGCRQFLDVVLSEGDVLYVPAGFPHTTQTLPGSRSLHLTLDAREARGGALHRKRHFNDLIPERDLDPATYWAHSRKTLPRLGWRRSGNDDDDLRSVARFIATSAHRVEPGRFDSWQEASEDLDAPLVARRLVDHAANLVDVQRRLYHDVVFQAEKLGLATHFANLERTQVDLAQWFERGPAIFAEPVTEGPVVESKYRMGSPVDVLDSPEFVDAVVDLVHPDGACDVVSFKDDREVRVPPDRLRPRNPAPHYVTHPSSASSAAGGGGKKKKKAKASTGFGGARAGIAKSGKAYAKKKPRKKK